MINDDSDHMIHWETTSNSRTCKFKDVSRVSEASDVCGKGS